MTPCSVPIGGLSVTGRGSNLNQTSSAEPIHQLPAFRRAAKVTDELEIPVREFGDMCELTQNSGSVKRSSTNGAFPAGVMFHRLKRCVCGFIQNAGRSSVKEKSTKEIQRNPPSWCWKSECWPNGKVCLLFQGATVLPVLGIVHDQ